MNKIWIILLAAPVVMALATFLFLRFSFAGGRVSLWQEGSSTEALSWDRVFSQSTDLQIYAINCGTAQAAPGWRPFLNGDTLPNDYPMDEVLNSPIMTFALRHPHKGDILIDSGLSGDFEHSPQGNLSAMLVKYQQNNHYQYLQESGMGLGAQLENLSLSPDIVLMTHMHPDHTSGLPELRDDITLLFGRRENSFFYRMMNFPFYKGVDNLRTLDFDKASPLAPFSKVIDLFGDQSVLAISSRGHTRDHISYFINDRENPSIVVGDLAVDQEYLEKDYQISVDSRRTGWHLQQQSLAELEEFTKLYPHVRLYYSHQGE